MSQVNIYEAKTQLSRLIERARAGEDVVIARAGTPLVRLVPVERSLEPRRLGLLAGKVRLGRDWDSDQTNAEIAELFGGGTPEAPAR
jgi:prevent-host-death family protein